MKKNKITNVMRLFAVGLLMSFSMLMNAQEANQNRNQYQNQNRYTNYEAIKEALTPAQQQMLQTERQVMKQNRAMLRASLSENNWPFYKTLL